VYLWVVIHITTPLSLSLRRTATRHIGRRLWDVVVFQLYVAANRMADVNFTVTSTTPGPGVSQIYRVSAVIAEDLKTTDRVPPDLRVSVGTRVLHTIYHNCDDACISVVTDLGRSRFLLEIQWSDIDSILITRSIVRFIFPDDSDFEDLARVQCEIKLRRREMGWEFVAQMLDNGLLGQCRHEPRFSFQEDAKWWLGCW